MIFHITSRAEWQAAQAKGEYTAPSLASQGFIHCSTAAQVIHVANAFYRGQANLIVLVLDEMELKSELRWEPPDGPPAAGISASDLFPHIFGAVNLEAVVRIVELVPDSAGTFAPPRLR
jgi:uncharacterized protein (DUF952 family)